MSKDYKVYYVTGGGREMFDGVWSLRSHTDKYRTFERKTSGFYKSAHLPGEIGKTVRIPNEMSEGLFSIYPLKAGIPHIFEPIQPC